MSRLDTISERNRSVDVVARLGDKALIIKVVNDASKLTRQEISDLKKARIAYNASTVIVAHEDRSEKMEDEVVYYKYGSIIITPGTLEQNLVKNEKLIVAYIRGNYILKINPEKFKKKLEETRISRGAIADALGISKKAVYMYERGEMYITLEKGLKLASLLGEDVFDEFDIFNESITEESPGEDLALKPRDEVERILYKIASNMRKTLVAFSRMPVDIVLKGRTCISIVKENVYEDLREKIENAGKLAEKINSKLILVKSPRDVLQLKDIEENPNMET